MKWKTYGDEHLKNAEETRRIASFAVYLSRWQVTQANDQVSPDPDPQEVLDLLPDEKSVEQAMTAAIADIPAAIEALPELMYAQRGVAQATYGTVFGGLLTGLAATSADPGLEKNILQQEERSKALGGGPLLYPQFTFPLNK